MCFHTISVILRLNVAPQILTVILSFWTRTRRWLVMWETVVKTMLSTACTLHLWGASSFLYECSRSDWCDKGQNSDEVERATAFRCISSVVNYLPLLISATAQNITKAVSWEPAKNGLLLPFVESDEAEYGISFLIVKSHAFGFSNRSEHTIRKMKTSS